MLLPIEEQLGTTNMQFHHRQIEMGCQWPVGLVSPNIACVNVN